MPVALSIEIPATPDEVWADLADVASHVEWMADAVAIEFLSSRRTGRGTRARVMTRFGPIRTADIMEFTAWDAPRRMAVEHQGIFGGTGELILEPIGHEATILRWAEQITFPWYLMGSVGARLAQPIFRVVWRRSLRRLRDRFTGPRTEGPASRGTR